MYHLVSILSSSHKKNAPLAKDGEGSGSKPWVMAPFALELLGAPRDHPQICSLHDGNARGTCQAPKVPKSQGPKGMLQGTRKEQKKGQKMVV